MSVVNKMLRDLDQRHGTHAVDTSAAHPPFAAELKKDTFSIAPGEAGLSRAAMGRRLGLAVVVCAVLAALAWYAAQKRAQDVPTVPVPIAVVAPQPTQLPAPQVPDAAPTPPANAPALTSSPVLATAPVEPPSLEAQPAPTTPKATVTRATPDPLPVPVVSLRMENMLSTRQLTASAVEAKVPPSPKSASSAPEAAPNLQRQQQASADALAQAQTLWSAGSQAAAIDLMQQAVDAAERAVKAGNSPPGNPVLLSQVRELTRMQMALGRYGPVWDTLSRLEPVLGNAPDLWGLRGNTAQRLGRHADSVRAYTAALQSRPNEQRWMLGAAVSMAALGQTDQAAAMAEKAHDVGEISREVQTYLHQMGVPLKAR